MGTRILILTDPYCINIVTRKAPNAAINAKFTKPEKIAVIAPAKPTIPDTFALSNTEDNYSPLSTYIIGSSWSSNSRMILGNHVCCMFSPS